MTDNVGQRCGSCCGPSFHCEQLTDDCLPYLRSQNRACAIHDRRLANECRAPWYDLVNPCVRNAHRELSETSIDPLIAAPFEVLSRSGSSSLPETSSGVFGPAYPAGLD
jgi:hypothetical protein